MPRSALTVRDPLPAYRHRMFSSNSVDLQAARSMPSGLDDAAGSGGGADPSAATAGRPQPTEAFLDILSHELRTPVTTIYAGAQILATRELSSEHRQALAADVRSEADRLYRLVEDLMILARSERDEIRPVGEPVAVRHLVVAAIEREVARHPDSRILLLGANDASAGSADEGMVMHVIRNLLDNALRYGSRSGPVEVLIDVTATEVIVRVIDRGRQPEDAAPSPRFRDDRGRHRSRSGRSRDRSVCRRTPRQGDARADVVGQGGSPRQRVRVRTGSIRSDASAG